MGQDDYPPFLAPPASSVPTTMPAEEAVVDQAPPVEAGVVVRAASTETEPVPVSLISAVATTTPPALESTRTAVIPVDTPAAEGVVEGSTIGSSTMQGVELSSSIIDAPLESAPINVAPPATSTPAPAPPGSAPPGSAPPSAPPPPRCDDHDDDGLPQPPPLATQPPQPKVKKPKGRKRKEVDRDQAPPTPASTASSSESVFTAIPSFISSLDPSDSESDSSASEDEFGQPKPPKQPVYDSQGRPRPRPSYYYDADYDPAHHSVLEPIKKRGRRGGLKGVPVFEPTMEDFAGNGGFYGYVKRIEKYGMRSGIAKVIPPKEWTDSLPSTTDKLREIRLREPIEQIMMGQQGVYRVTNVAKTRIWNPAQWKQMADSSKFAPPDFKKEAEKGDRTDRKPVIGGGNTTANASTSTSATPNKKGNRKGAGVEGDADRDDEVETETAGKAKAGLQTPANDKGKEPETPRQTRSGTRFGSDVKNENRQSTTATPSGSPTARKASIPTEAPSTSTPTPTPAAVHEAEAIKEAEATNEATTSTTALASATKPARVKRASNLQRAEPTDEEWNAFVEKYAELPHGMKKSDYTVELMRDIERRYWRTLTFGEPAMYGADMKGSIFSDQTQAWNVAHLGDLLPKLAPKSCQIPGVVSPYLYFGMWRATFAWHVEDADLYSINYIHFGAPKFWYSVPQEQSERFERVMEGYFQQDRTKCSQFLRHKSFLASPRVLAGSNITLNRCMQLPGEFILTYPKGYHSGFNLGFNCAESINFATERWLPLGKVSKSCFCIGDSVNIDVDVWLTDAARKEAEARGEVWPPRKAMPTPPPEEELQAAAAEMASFAGTGQGLAISTTLTTSSAPSHQHGPAVFEVPKLEAAPSSSGRKRMFSAKTAELELGQVQAATPTTVSSSSQPHPHPHPTSINSNVSQTPPKKKIKLSASASASASTSDSAMPLPYPCALCPERSIEGLIKIGEPAQFNMSAHRVCVMFTPATWIVTIPETGEDVVRGFLDIEKARWKLKCQLCEEKHGIKVQCTKGKCPKAMHVTCGLRLDSGAFLDATVDGVSMLDHNRIEGASPKTKFMDNKSLEPVAAGDASAMVVDGVQPAAGAPSDAAAPFVAAAPSDAVTVSTSDAAPGSTSDSAPESAPEPALAPPASIEESNDIQLTILCRQHNPAWQKLEIERKYEELKARVAALPENTRLQVKTNNGVFDVTYLTNLPHKSSIGIMFDDGKRHEVRWRAILWPESPEAIKRKVEIAAKIAEDKAAYDRPPTKKRISFPEDGSMHHPYSGRGSPYAHTSLAAAYMHHQPAPRYFYAPQMNGFAGPGSQQQIMQPSMGHAPPYGWRGQYFGGGTVATPGSYPYPPPMHPVHAAGWSGPPPPPLGDYAGPYGHQHQQARRTSHPYAHEFTSTSASSSGYNPAPLSASIEGPHANRNSHAPSTSSPVSTFVVPRPQDAHLAVPSPAPPTSSRHSLKNLLSPLVDDVAVLGH
ncbi:BQ2448_6011 [Microbotryum intermedium]|uniref:[histone H3]-trimethyl-L-lysine(9) demethylase n=1 Tax=Microbotryum intermedium TaxID=269621 RepID=A0A238F2X7_9BASI|nr:BQ2448_6011 [Microbotryum intermedium]